MASPATPTPSRKRPNTVSPIDMQREILLASSLSNSVLKRTKQTKIKSMFIQSGNDDKTYRPTSEYEDDTLSDISLTQVDQTNSDFNNFVGTIDKEQTNLKEIDTSTSLTDENTAKTHPINTFSEQDDSIFDKTVEALTHQIALSFHSRQVKDAIRPFIEQMVQEEIKKQVAPLQNEIESLKLQLATTSLHLNASVQDKCDELEQYSRKNCIRISGIKEDLNENVEGKIMKVLSTIDNSLSPNNIENCHRLGRKQANKHRQIIVRLKSYKTKVHIMKNRKMAQTAIKGVYINEDLTRYRAYVASITRWSYKQGFIAACWTRDGKIFIRENSTVPGKNGPTRKLTSPVEVPGYKPTSEELINYNLTSSLQAQTDSPSAEI
ncbi:hypothetical protein SNE40_002893 [Patella caerulea]|uniref:Uncharacterized protein n=1 Tax=Patella caerulea TaxID=87958 RepID=A0AAN8KEW3_PATCE